MTYVLFEWLEKSRPEVFATLCAPAAADIVERVETELGVSLPPALVRLHREHDGQLQGRMATCVFEAYRWLPLDESLAERRMWIDVLAGVHREFPESSPWTPTWLPFARDDLGNVWVVDVATGCVFPFEHDEGASAPLAASFEAFLADYVRSFETGERVLDPKLGAMTRAALQHPVRTEPVVDPKRRRRTIAFLALYGLIFVLFIVWLESRR